MAWETYIHLTQTSTTPPPSNDVMRDYARMNKSSPKAKKEVEGSSNHRNAMKLYGTPPQTRSLSSRKSKSRKARRSDAKNVNHKHVPPIPSEIFHGGNEDGDNQAVDEPRSPHRHEAKRLACQNRIKDRLRGQYLRFDIPDSLDDTVRRFIVAVMLRYKFDSHDSAFSKESHQQRCLADAEPIIQRLHGMGIVFIRQILPVRNMALTLSNMGVSEEFLLMSIFLLNVLHQMTGGNYLNRKYLTSKCRHLLDAQKQLKDSPPSEEAKDKLHFNLAYFLGECGAAGSDSYDDDDNPGGIWGEPRGSSSVIQPECRQENNRSTVNTIHATSSGTRHRSWVLPYTAKILAENESSYPALKAYRHGLLLD